MNRHQRRTLSSLKRRGLLKEVQVRTQQELNQDYTSICSQLGQISEIRRQLDKDEDALFTRLDGLKSEAEALKAQESKQEEAQAVASQVDQGEG